MMALSERWTRLHLTDFLLSHTQTEDDPELVHRVLFLCGFSALGALVLFLLGGIAIFQGALLLGGLDLMAAGILSSLILLVRFKGFHVIYIFIGITTMYFFYVYLFISGGSNGTGFMWLYTFPLFSHYALGSRHGLLVSMALFLPISIFLIVSIFSPDLNIYDSAFTSRFVLSYLIVSLFVYLYEKSRAKSYEAWMKINSHLECVVEERTKSLNIEIEKGILRERALEKSEQRLSLALKGAKCGLWDWNVLENKVHFDRNFYQISGYAPDSFPQTHDEWKQRIHPEDIGSVKSALKDYVSGKTKSFSVEFRFLKQDASWMWILGQGEVFEWSADGKPQRLSGLQIDIHDRKIAEQERLALEAQLRQKYKMEAVGVMAGGMAHNFNNNLSIILGNVELSKMKMPDNPDVRSYMDNAKIAVLRSRDLIQQILTYSRQGAKDKTAVQLPLIIDETLQLLRATMPTSIYLEKKISPHSDRLAIKADSSQIQECLINLCNNAMYAMDEKGTLTISLDSIELQKKEIPAQYACRPGQYAKLSVQDDGSGMSAETIDKVFDLFFTTKPVNEGTGVGLSTVQGIITQHGGLIKVNSQLGQGTTFELYFPVIGQTQPTEITDINTDMPEGTEHILFVDDDPMLASLGEQMLKTKGYTVTTVTDSPEALKLFKANPTLFDLLITDQTMPELTGKDLIQKFKTIRPDIPAIICTGHSRKIDEDTARELGASAFLMKPLDMPKLLQTVRRILGEKETAPTYLTK